MRQCLSCASLFQICGTSSGIYSWNTFPRREPTCTEASADGKSLLRIKEMLVLVYQAYLPSAYVPYRGRNPMWKNMWLSSSEHIHVAQNGSERSASSVEILAHPHDLGCVRACVKLGTSAGQMLCEGLPGEQVIA